ncbi:hypothetical protein TWF730_003755 [Orbilia blumenaviensis]|uniref:Nephrocystin 3-like N-terminal domain-containing protein n=1 Tax=Orbilia blumenaviensis TaxID=1796055 RepID=A0AAV9U5D2_9PEZI
MAVDKNKNKKGATDLKAGASTSVASLPPTERIPDVPGEIYDTPPSRNDDSSSLQGVTAQKEGLPLEQGAGETRNGAGITSQPSYQNGGPVTAQNGNHNGAPLTPHSKPQNGEVVLPVNHQFGPGGPVTPYSNAPTNLTAIGSGVSDLSRNDKVQVNPARSPPHTKLLNGSAGWETKSIARDYYSDVKTTITTSEYSSTKYQSQSNGSHMVSSTQSKGCDHAEKIRTLLKRCRNELGSDADRVLKGCLNLESFKRFVNAQRIRDMPDEGSVSDNSMRWVGQFGERLEIFAQQLTLFFPGSSHKQTSESLLGCCKSLLLIGSRDSDALQRFFDELYKIAIALESFEPHRDVYVSSPELQRVLLAVFWNIVELVIRITLLFHNVRITRSLITESEEVISAIVRSFVANKEILELEIWITRLRESPIVQGTGPVSVQDLKSWLRQGVVETPKPTISEGTCTWFDRILSDLKDGEDQLLYVTGKTGCGKSMLANWVVDRLRLHKQDILMSFSFDTTVNNGTTTVFFLKTLLLQLLNKSLGNVVLFKKLADIHITAASNECSAAADLELERALWDVFAVSARNTRQLNLVIDGLDHVAGGRDKAQDIVNRIREIIDLNGANSLNCVFLSAPFSPPLTGRFTDVKIDEENTRYDIKIHVQRVLDHFFSSSDVSLKDRNTVIELLAKQADGSFPVANLLIQNVKRGKNIAEILKTLGSINSTGAAGLLDALLANINFSNPDTMRILSWMLVSEEPISIQHMKELLEVTYGDNSPTRAPRLKWDVERDIIQPCGSLVVVDRNLLQFSHHSLKEHFWKKTETQKSLPDRAKCNTEVVLSLLAYIKTANMPNELERGFKPPSREIVTHTLEQHGLLSYAIRKWLFHFRQSSISQSGKSGQIRQLMPVFPAEPNFPQLEYALWVYDKVPENDFLLASTIRQMVLTNVSATIHSFINLTRVRVSSGKIINALQDCYKAFKLSITLFGTTSREGWDIASEFSSISKRHEETEYDGEVYEWMIDYVKCQDSKQFTDEIVDIVKRYGEILLRKNKEQDAMKHYRWLWTECCKKYGDTDSRSSFVLDLMGPIIQKDPSSTEYLDLCIRQLNITETKLNAWEKERIKAVIKLSSAYECCGKSREVREAFDKAIKALTLALAEHTGEEVLAIHEGRIHLIIEYAKYYSRTSSRDSGVLLLREFWQMYRPDVKPLRSHSTGLIIQLISLAELLDASDLLEEAEELYSSLWSYFKQTPELSTSQFAYTVGCGLARLRKNGRGDPKEEEGVLCGLVDILNPSGIENLTAVGLDAFLQLTRFYQGRNDWRRSDDSCKRGLERYWPAILCGDCADTLTLPQHYEERGVDLAYLTARGYAKNDSARACHQYKLVWRACQNTMMPNTKPRVIRAFKDYTTFCHEHGRHDEALSATISYFDTLCKNPGISHESTIEIGLSLAEMYQRERRIGDAINIYQRISYALLQTTLTKRTFDILATLFSVFENAPGQEAEAREFCSAFWGKLASTKHWDFHPDADLVFKIYTKHRLDLERSHAPASEIIALVQNLMHIYAHSVGENSSYYFKAQLAYATLLEQDKSKAKVTITEYERLLEIARRTTSHEDNTSIMLQIQQSLAKLYLLDQTTAGKAEDLYRNLFEEFRGTYGPTHRPTLGALEQLVQFYSNKKDTQTALNLLQNTIMDILSTETREKYLFDSALSIAKLFFVAGNKDLGSRLIVDLRKYCRLGQEERRAFDSRDSRFKKLAFRNSQSLMMERKYQVFFATFELVMRKGGKVESEEELYGSVISLVLQESEHYMAWLGATKFGDGLDVILAAGARLRAFLYAQNRHSEFEFVEKDLRTIFLREFKTFGLDNNDKTSIRLQFSDDMLEEFFQECLSLFADLNISQSLSLVDVGLKRVEATINVGDIDAAFIIAVWTHKLMATEQVKHAYVFRLLFYMTSDKVKATPNPALKADIGKFTQLILREILSSDTGVSWVSVALTDLDKLVVLLGTEKRWDFMLTILEQLWQSRNTHDDIWSPRLVTTIGCRLVDAYMQQGQKESALRVLERIYYNYSRVFGILQPETQQFGRLLCRIYNSAGYYNKTISVTERLFWSLREECAGGAGSKEQVSDLIFHHLDLLKFANQSKKTQLNTEHLAPMVKELQALFYVKNSRWNEIVDFNAWAQKPVSQDDKSFIWQSPSSWRILEDDGPDDQAKPSEIELARRQSLGPSKAEQYKTFSRSSFASLFQA